MLHFFLTGEQNVAFEGEDAEVGLQVKGEKAATLRRIAVVLRSQLNGRVFLPN